MLRGLVAPGSSCHPCIVGEAEVDDVGCHLVSHQDVLGLEVPVDDALPVQEGDGPEDPVKELLELHLRRCPQVDELPEAILVVGGHDAGGAVEGPRADGRREVLLRPELMVPGRRLQFDHLRPLER